MKYSIHISDVRAFKQCRRRWYWSSMLPGCLGLEKRITYAPFFTGSAVHYGLQEYYETGELPVEAANRHIKERLQAMESVGALWPSEMDTFEEQVTLINGMLEHYNYWTRTTHDVWSDSNLRFLSLETEFDVPFKTPAGRASNRISMGGRFDGVVQRMDNKSYWIFENKTSRSIDELLGSLKNDEQAGAYIIAAEHILGVQISGVLYNILRKKVPTKPQVLKNGNLSERADADTTAQAFFEDACAHHNTLTREEVKEKYSDYLNTLLASGKKFFERVPIFRTRNELVQLQRDLWTVGLEMTRKDVPLYPTPSWLNCKFCSFRSPCFAYNAGSDYKYILEQEYQHREKWNPLEGKAESESQD